MDERAHSQKEIDRLKDMLSQTSGNLQQELEKRDKEIARLQQRVADLERDL